MKILVAGGAGYIGSALVPELLVRGYEVYVVDALWFGNHLPSEVWLTPMDLFHVVPDQLRDMEIDQVVYLAGLSNDPMAEFDPSLNFIHNAALPTYLAFCAKQAGVKRFIHGGSCSVYGYTVNELYDESSPAVCAYPYGISKLQGESGCMQLAPQEWEPSSDNAFSVIALRQGTVGGYSPRMRFDLVVNTMFKDALTKREITVNNPSIWRPLLDIRDAVSAYLRAIQAAPSISGVFNVASGNYTIGQVADAVRDVIGDDVQIRILDMQDFRNYKVACDRANTLLGFRPQRDVHQTVEYLWENGDAYGDFDDPMYYNIRVFKELGLSYGQSARI